MAVALGIANVQGGAGTTDKELRYIIDSQFQTTGVVKGLRVVGSRTNYNISSGVAICARGTSDGKTMAYYEGGQVTASANPSANARIDSVYIYANDQAQGDPDNLVHVGVSQGTPSVAPAAPTIPFNATIIAQVLVPASSVSLNNAYTINGIPYAIPYGSSLGILLDKTDTRYGPVLRHQPYTFASGSFYIPARRLLTVNLTTTLWAYKPETIDWLGSGYVEWVLDGRVQRDFRMLLYPDSTTCHFFSDTVVANEGNHTVLGILYGSDTNPKSDIWTDYSSGNWPGQRLQVIDGGSTI